MSENDLPEFLQLMATIGMLYQKELSKSLINIHWQALSQYSLARIRQGFEQHIRDKKRGRFFPTPADILSQLSDDDENCANAAWELVIETVGRVGAYSDVSFDDPLIGIVLREMGGWSRLCRGQESDLPFKRKQFLSKYSHYLKKPPSIGVEANTCFRGLSSRYGGLLESQTVRIQSKQEESNCPNRSTSEDHNHD